MGKTLREHFDDAMRLFEASQELTDVEFEAAWNTVRSLRMIDRHEREKQIRQQELPL